MRAAGAPLAPIFAQQSVRELDRIRRTPVQVLDAATWGILAEGWQQPFGADADHVKSPQDIDRFLDSGYTQFTLDPGGHVRDEAETASAAELDELLAALPWERLRDTPEGVQRRHAGRTVALVDRPLTLSGEDAARAAAKYGAAIAQVALLAEHLAARLAPGSYEIEVSLDEAATPTTAAQHAFVAHELTRLGVRWVGLAPRFVGEMQKGIDYLGDLDRFARELAVHAQIAQALGPYKLSIHSGSDKFSIYPIAASLAPAAVHLKTSGTSYLEALRVLSLHDPDLLRRIYTLALNRLAADRASYQLSVDADTLPAPDALRNGQLPALLGNEGTRAGAARHVRLGARRRARGRAARADHRAARGVRSRGRTPSRQPSAAVRRTAGSSVSALREWFGLEGRVAVVTGGSGVLGSAIARALAGAGARVALLGRRRQPLLAIAQELQAFAATDAIAVTADVLAADELHAGARTVVARWERIDILVNAAGGNVPGATVGDRQTVLELPADAFREVVELNLLGTLLPAQVFGTAILDSAKARGEQPSGSIVNVSSMSAGRAITRVAGYGAAKAALESLTRSLAVELARSCGPGLRVNAIAPGFFVSEQNRRLLLGTDGEPTPRGRTIIERTPAGRFGDASELADALVWLVVPGRASSPVRSCR